MARTRWLAVLMFVLSGAAGLVFEVAMQRSLTRVFGVSAFATSTVLAAWMTGTALGALLFGGLAQRTRSPLRLYAWLEVGIAAAAFILPSVVPGIIATFAASASSLEADSAALLGLRLALAFAITLVPTLLMGGTLPAMARGLGPAENGDATLAKLYTANLLGAVIGAACSSYVLMPTFGLSTTQAIGGVMNLAAALVAFVIARGAALPVDANVTPSLARAPLRLLAVSAWSGLATFCAEVTWFHLLGVVVGNSVYAFGIMLTTFLAGLSLGSSWLSRREPQHVDEKLLGKAQLAVALGLLLTLPLWDKVPTTFLVAGKWATSFSARELVRVLVCLELTLLPAIALGTIFPLVLRVAWRTNADRAPVGGLVAANTAGAIVGSLLTGFVLLPRFGSRAVLLLLLVVSAVFAALLLRRWARAAAVATVVFALLLPAWDMGRLAAGTNVYFSMPAYAGAEVLSVRESVEAGLTSVVRSDGELTLLTNGKFQGNDSEEVTAQLGFAQIPMLVQRRWDSALVVGLGTGTSLGALTTQPYVDIDVVELSSDIIDAARQYFGHVNERALDHPRVRVVRADARNFLLLSTRRYELISIEITSIWFAGAADLYNREFYALIRKHLSDTGVLQQWVQLHHLTRRNLAVVLASVRSELPHVALFEYGGQGLILASAAPLQGDYETLAKLSHTPAARGVIGGDLLALSGQVLLDADGVDALIEEERAGTPLERFVSTDDSLHLEFSTPRGNADESLTVSALISSLQHLPAKQLSIATTTQAQQRHVTGAWELLRGSRAKAFTSLGEGGAPAQPLLDWATKNPELP